MNEINNKKYLNNCAEALASYLNCEKEEINIEEEEDYLIHSTYELNGDFYKIAPAENIVEYIKNDLVPNKIYEIEMELKHRGLYDYIEDLDTYTIEEEIFDNLEDYFDAFGDRIPFDYNKQSYAIFKL